MKIVKLDARSLAARVRDIEDTINMIAAGREAAAVLRLQGVMRSLNQYIELQSEEVLNADI